MAVTEVWTKYKHYLYIYTPHILHDLGQMATDMGGITELCFPRSCKKSEILLKLSWLLPQQP